MPEEQATLAESDTPTKWKETFGFQMKGVERTGLQRLLVKTAQNLGVEIKWNHSLLSLEQGSDEVRVVFENGHTDTASFVVGCDGLHSSTRASLFGREKADFTGLTQVHTLSLSAKILIEFCCLDGWPHINWRQDTQTFQNGQYLRKQ